MRIDQLHLYGFGPHINCDFQFQPGLNIVWGLNESGKSSLIQALVASLVGRRVKRGKATAEEAEFRSRYEPWDRRAKWRTRVTLILADGREIELDQNLTDPGSSTAFDRRIGASGSPKSIRHELLDKDGKSLDASLFLGLQRNNFAATAVVSQGQVSAAFASSDVVSSLREAIERAATSHLASSTTEQAIGAIKQFRAERIGTEHRNSHRPLAKAKEEIAAVETQIGQSQRFVEDYDRRLLILRTEQAETASLEKSLHHCRAIEAAQELASISDRIERFDKLGAAIAQAEVASIPGCEREVEVHGLLDALRSIGPEPPLPETSSKALEFEAKEDTAQPVEDVPAEVTKRVADLRDLLEYAHRLEISQPVPLERPTETVDELTTELEQRRDALASATAVDDQLNRLVAGLRTAHAHAERLAVNFAHQPSPTLTAVPLRSSEDLKAELNALGTQQHLAPSVEEFDAAVQIWRRDLQEIETLRVSGTPAELVEAAAHAALESYWSPIEPSAVQLREIRANLDVVRDAESRSAEVAPSLTSEEVTTLLRERELLSAAATSTVPPNPRKNTTFIGIAILGLGCVVAIATGVPAIAGALLVLGGCLAAARWHGEKARRTDATRHGKVLAEFETTLLRLGIEPGREQLEALLARAQQSEFADARLEEWKGRQRALEATEFQLTTTVTAWLDSHNAPPHGDEMTRAALFRQNLVNEATVATNEAFVASLRSRHQICDASVVELAAARYDVHAGNAQMAIGEVAQLVAAAKLSSKQASVRHHELVELTRSAEEIEQEYRFSRQAHDLYRNRQAELEHEVDEAATRLHDALRAAGFNAPLRQALDSFDRHAREVIAWKTSEGIHLGNLAQRVDRVNQAWNTYDQTETQTSTRRAEKSANEAAVELAVQALRKWIEQTSFPNGLNEPPNRVDGYDAHIAKIRQFVAQHNQRVQHERLEARTTTSRLAEILRMEVTHRDWTRKALGTLSEARDECVRLGIDLHSPVTAERSHLNQLDASIARETEALVAALAIWCERVSQFVRTRSDLNAWEIERRGLLTDGNYATLVSKRDRLRELAVLNEMRDVVELETPGISVEDLEGRIEDRKTNMSRLEGELRQAARNFPLLCELEETLFALRRHEHDLRKLDFVLERTENLLIRARAEANANLAPLIGDRLGSYLQLVSGGRYRKVSVNPETLAIQLETPTRWVSATDLSYGTTEQIYLLLRIVLADLLTKQGEKSPLFFDEVLAFADDERAASLLDLLNELSQTRQIFLFGHEHRLLEWAEANLSPSSITQLV